MVDIGAFNTCPHLCKYCYANFNENEVFKNVKLHSDTSSLLVGHLEKDDKITIRRK